MPNRGVIIVMNDAPTDEEFVEWLHGPHMEEVKRTPGIRRARRYEIVDGPADRRRFVGILETDDLDATLAWRASADGKRSQAEANERGVTNRYGLTCRLLYDSADETR